MITHLFFDAGNTLVYPNLQLVGERLAGRGMTVPLATLEQAEQETRFKLDDITLFVEQGFQGQSDKAPTGLVSDGWNGCGNSCGFLCSRP